MAVVEFHRQLWMPIKRGLGAIPGNPSLASPSPYQDSIAAATLHLTTMAEGARTRAQQRERREGDNLADWSQEQAQMHPLIGPPPQQFFGYGFQGPPPWWGFPGGFPHPFQQQAWGEGHNSHGSALLPKDPYKAKVVWVIRCRLIEATPADSKGLLGIRVKTLNARNRIRYIKLFQPPLLV